MANNYDDSENEVQSKFAEEYDNLFDADEKISSLLKLSSDAFTRKFATIEIRQIGFTDPVKKGRQKTMIGLTKTVQELGVLVPIHVMTVPEESADDEYKYILVDGIRRVFAALKNGQKEIDAVVWDFHDKDQGMDLALYIGLLLNKSQDRSWGEKWHLYQVLRAQSPNITRGTLESLLNMQDGDAAKLEDIMYCDYEDVKEALLSGEKTLDAAFKMLVKYKKEEDKLAIEDGTGVGSAFDGAEDITANNVGEGGQLSEDQVLELLDMVNDGEVEDVEEADFADLNKGVYSDEHQKVGERHPVDPAIRQGTFQRDGYKCRCCGTGGVAFLSTLVYHHAIPVHCGGADSIENGLTLCDSCHLTLHTTERNGGKIAMTKEQFDDYSEADQLRIKKIIKYAKIAVQAAQNRGISKDKVVQESLKSGRHRMPGENLAENQAGFAATNNAKVNERY